MLSASGVWAAIACLMVATPGHGEVLAKVSSTELTEASGLVASRKHPGILWVHNDSGDGPRLFAIREDGSVAMTVTLTGALARDWEDIAIGRGPDAAQDMLYVGDIGNNCECRTDLSVYRLTEPEPPATGQALDVPVSRYDRFPYTYPEKRANAEALLVDPRDGRLYLVDKVRTNTARLWQFPLPLVPGVSATLEEAARLNLPIPDPCSWSYAITGGDISPDGSLIALTTYTHVLLWHRSPGETLARAFGRLPEIIHRHDRPNTEALAILPDGKHYDVIPEGERPLLSRYELRRNPTPPARPIQRGLIDNFEDRDLFNALQSWGMGCFSGEWFAQPTGGSAPTPTMAVDEDASKPKGRNRVLHVHAGTPMNGAPPLGFFTFVSLAWDWATLDVSPARGIRFRAKTGSPCTVDVKLEGKVGDIWYKQDAGLLARVPLGPDWRTVELPWDAFKQPPAACPGANCLKEFQPSGVMMLGWAVPAEGNPELFLDDVSLFY